MGSRRSRGGRGVLLLCTVLAVAACWATPAAARTSSAKDHKAPAGAKPSKVARMICAHELRRELRGVLAARPTRVTEPTWVDHLYSCDYRYPEGTVTLSVKELAGTAETTAYFDGVAGTLGRRPGDVQLAQGAYQTTNGSMVVRKDDKVLVVDVSGLPADGFAKAGYTAEDIASAIAITVLGCWN